MKAAKGTVDSNIKKATQLGMSIGKAHGILKKSIMFMLVKKCNMDNCHRCNKKIKTVEELSIEHIDNWMNTNDPVGKFFDIDNISFSHRLCNISAPKNLPEHRKAIHPSDSTYKAGCRCEECRVAHYEYNKKYFKKNRIQQ